MTKGVRLLAETRLGQSVLDGLKARKERAPQPGSCCSRCQLQEDFIKGGGHRRSRKPPEAAEHETQVWGPNCPKAVLAKCSDLVGSDNGPDTGSRREQSLPST